MKTMEFEPKVATPQTPSRPASPSSMRPSKARSTTSPAPSDKTDDLYVTVPLSAEEIWGTSSSSSKSPERSINPKTGMRVLVPPSEHTQTSAIPSAEATFSPPPAPARDINLGNPTLGRRNSTGSIFSPRILSEAPKSSQTEPVLKKTRTSYPASEPTLSQPLSRRSSIASLAPSATMSEASLEGAALLDAVATRTRSARRAMSLMVATGSVGAMVGSMVAVSVLGPGAIPAFFLIWAGASAIGYLMSKFQQRKLTRDDELMRMTQRLAELIENPPEDMSKLKLKEAEDLVGFMRGNVLSYGLAEGMRLMAKPLKFKIIQAPVREWIEPKLSQMMDKIIDHQESRARANHAAKRGLRSESEIAKES